MKKILAALISIALTLGGCAGNVYAADTTAANAPPVSLGSGITGTLPVANGGTGVTTSTGTGATVRGTSPTITTPNIVGTVAADSATAGSVGEYVESVVSANANAATATFKDMTTLSITAGDWDCVANVWSILTGAGTHTQMQIGISTGTAGNAFSDAVDGSNNAYASFPAGFTNDAPSLAVPSYRVSVAATTTVRLKTKFTFSAGSSSSYGRLSCRRRR